MATLKKTQRPKRRYIAFTVDPSLTKDCLIPKFMAIAGNSASYVIQCSAGWCILRCQPKEIDDTIALMKRVDSTSSSVCTSGTLKSLRKTYPILQETRPPARR